MTSARDHAATAKRYRDQAEEFRAKAGVTADTTRAHYDDMADAYEKLADNEEMVAWNLDRTGQVGQPRSFRKVAWSFASSRACQLKSVLAGARRFAFEPTGAGRI